MKKLVVIYTRSSSAAQGDELQKCSAINYLESINFSGDEETVIYLSDHNVPASKLKTNPQTQLAKVVTLIEKGEVAKLIVYKRDRLARDPQDFMELAEIIIKHNVDASHSFRHTHTSLLAEAGVGLEEIMDRLGHQVDEVTRRVYLHVTNEMKSEASNKFSELMRSIA